MLSIPGKQAQLCDGVSRREFLRVGGAAMLGMSLPQILALQARANTVVTPSQPLSGFGKANSVILMPSTLIHGSVGLFLCASASTKPSV